ncbi:tyrosine-type recombinase/integrase [Dysosmobacter sp.]|uniref:tyrosine-type recombinase/integrase n=1 Tax=Dysosmobacter sp. TaxID=2591382 RepID=UPI002A9565B0|nr:site-specific integrase [Dysosmobacter sp.]MDY5509477.1 site-specific integrase [Dysosmobacter sp.]
MAKKKYATHVTLPTGRRVYVSGKSKADLDARVAQVRLEANAGVDVGNDIRFRDYTLAWLKAYKEPKLRPNSYATLRANVDNHILPFFGDMLIREIKPMHIQMFLGSIAGMSKSVQGKCVQILNSIFRTAADNGVILKSPVTQEARPQGENPKTVEPLTQEQAKALLDAVRDCKVYGFCLIALTTGLRRGEILGLMWEDIDLTRGKLTVRHNKTFPANANDAPVTTLLKTEAANRTITLPWMLRAWLEQERHRSASPYVLSMENGQSLTKSAFRRMWSAIEVRTVQEGRPLGTAVGGSKTGPVKVTLDFKCHPHQLRHTCITQWVESGMKIKQVQYLAGHKTLDMTLRVYTHYRRQSQEDEVAQAVNDATAYLAG